MTRNIATYVLAISLFCLAGALVYFSLKISDVTETLPSILEQVENTSAKIEPVLKEINEIQDLIPPILDEVKQTRELIPPIVNEVKEIREIVPGILVEVDKITTQLPAILKTTDGVSDAVIVASKEIAETRKIIPDVLDEVEKTRVAIPPMLTKAEHIVAGATKAGRHASEGAVTGVITGIIAAPFRIVGGIGKSVFGSLNTEAEGISEDDKEAIAKLSNELFVSGVVGDSRTFDFPNNDNVAKLSVLEIETIEDRECKILKIHISENDRVIFNEKVTGCLNKDLKWEILE